MLTRPIVPARVVFSDGEPPRSPDFDDVYHPSSGAGLQAREVFLAGNGLPARWAGRERFTILETGFGLGNNFLATWQAWRDDPARCERLSFVSLEEHPLTQADLARAHATSEWPARARELIRQWPVLTPNVHPLHFDEGRVQLLLVLGDARHTLPALQLRADAVLLDGFAPGRNPNMWNRRLLKVLAHRCAPGATAATWSVAGELRRTLGDAGFLVDKVRGSGGKREVLRATLRPHTVPRQPPANAAFPRREALVIGAGLAGAWAGDALRRQGWRVTVLERRPEPALETSGNAAGIFHGVVHGADGTHARLFRAAALWAERRLRPLIDAGRVSGQLRGLLRLSGDTPQQMHALVARQGLPAGWVQVLTQEQASALAGLPLPACAWLFPGGGWASPRELVQALLDQPGILFRGDVVVARLVADESAGWVAQDAAGRVLGSAPVVVLANAADAAALAAPHGEAVWPLTLRSATVTHLRTRASPPGIPVAGGGYVIADPRGGLWAGGSLAETMALAGEVTDSRSGQRLQTPDRLPIVGPLALPAADIPAGTRLDQARLLPRRRGLFVMTALGSRGLTLAPLCAELLAAQISGAPLPLEQALVDALDAGRFRVGAQRRGTAVGTSVPGSVLAR